MLGVRGAASGKKNGAATSAGRITSCFLISITSICKIVGNKSENISKTYMLNTFFEA